MSKTVKQQKVKNILKREKHALHREFGCSRVGCTTCFNGYPWQLYLNLSRNKKGK